MFGHNRYYLYKQLKAEQDMIDKIESKTINITDMTIKDLFDEFYIYKSDKVKQTTLRSYNQRIVYLNQLENVKIKDFKILLLWKKILNLKLVMICKNKKDFEKPFNKQKVEPFGSFRGFWLIHSYIIIVRDIVA